MFSNTDLAPAVLIIGTGMYVCGRHTESFGTVLPIVAQAQSCGLVGDIFVAGTSTGGVQMLRDKLAQLNASLGIEGKIKGYPAAGGPDPLAYREALGEIARPACAIVVVPDHLHTIIAADVIRAGLHVLIVKPLAPTLAEALQLTKMMEERNVYGAVEFHKRFDEANLILRQIIADGRLGELRFVTVEYSQRRVIRKVFESWAQHTNVFQYLGVHYVDLIYFATGARPVRILATGQPSSLANNNLDRLDSIQALVEWRSGNRENSFISTIVTNWIDPDKSSAMSDQKIGVMGTFGRYESDQKNRGVQMVTEQNGVEDINPYFSQIYMDATGKMGIEGYGPRSIRQFLTDIRDLINGRCEPWQLVSTRPSFREALVSTAVIEAVNQSLSRGGEWVAIDQALLDSAMAR